MLYLDPLGQTKLQIIGGVLVTMGTFGLMRPMIWQMLHERGLRKHPAYYSRIRYIFSAEGMKMAGKAGAVKVPWNEFFEVVNSPKGLFFYQNKKSYIFIPSSDLSVEDAHTVLGFWEHSL